MIKHIKKNMILRVCIWILTFIWLLGIFFLSSRPVDVSRQDSAWFMEKLGLTDSLEEGTDINNEEMMGLQQYIRKKAHIILFSILSILIFLSLYGYVGYSAKTALISFSLTTFYGATDEFHQIFSKRGAQIPDIIVDARGAVWGLMFVVTLFIIIENSKNLKANLNKIYNFNTKL